MLAAIDGAQQQILLRDLHLEGRRGRRAVQDRAGRRRRPRRRGLLHLRRVREPRRLAAVQALPGVGCKVLRYPIYNAGWRSFDLRRYGRDHRKILVVDDEVGVRRRLQHRHAVRHRVARHPRAGSPGPGVWDLKRAFADFWNLNRRRRSGASERPLLLETAVDLGADDPVPPQRAAAVDVPDPVDVPRGDQPGQPQHLDDPRLLHPRPGLRRRADGRGPARGRRTHPAAGQVQPRRRRLDLPRLLLPAARRRGADLPVPATRWCTPRPPPSTAPGRPSAPRTSTGSA